MGLGGIERVATIVAAAMNEHNIRDDYNIPASIREAILKRQVSLRMKGQDLIFILTHL